MSTNPYFYNTNSPPIPLFSEKKEFQFSGSGRRTLTADHEEAQASYSITKKLALMGSVMFHQIDREKNTSLDGTYFESGIGHYKKLPHHLIFETYAGMGMGYQIHSYQKDTITHWGGLIWSGPVQGTVFDNINHITKGDAYFIYYKYFIQPILGYRSKYFEAGVACRLSSVYYSNVHNNIYSDYVEYDRLMNIQIHPWSLFCEPSIMVRGGLKFLKIQLQITPPLQLTGPIMAIEYTHFSFGLNVFLSKDMFRIGSKTTP